MASYLDGFELPPSSSSDDDDDVDDGAGTVETGGVEGQRAPFLRYRSARVAWPRLRFTYTVNDEAEMQSECFLPEEVARRGPPTEPEALRRLETAAFHVGMVVLTWCWMACGPRRVVVSAGHLDEEQVAWWEWFYANIFAEFAAVNGFSEEQIRVSVEMDSAGLRRRGQVPAAPRHASPPPDPGDSRVLCLLGGGKDSLVVHRMLRDAGVAAPTWLYVGDGRREFDDSGRLQEVVRRSGSPVLVMAHDFNYDALARIAVTSAAVPGQWLTACGHPWAALVGFDAALIAGLCGYDYVAVGNERSANYGNGMSVGSLEVNHQFDKSFAFERRMHEYIRRHIAPGAYYFSALQHLWEVQIAWLFCRRSRDFLDAFISCNESEGLNEWCCACDKCCFVFALMSAWEPPGTVARHFGRDLFEVPELLRNFRSLLGVPEGAAGEDERPLRVGVKPFECVGTQEEVLLSLWLAREAARSSAAAGQAMPLALASLPLDNGQAHLGLLTDHNPDNLLPDWLVPGDASPACEAGSSPTEFRSKWKRLWEGALAEVRKPLTGATD